MHVFSSSVSGSVYVGGNGTNTVGCGTYLSPCKTIEFAVDHILPPVGGDINLQSTTPVVEASRYGIKIKTSRSIRIIGGEHNQPAVVKAFFYLPPSASNIHVKITFVNMKLLVEGKLFEIESK